ncbi:hypothetical protein J6590_035123 [Homalodisca vitripennis]|nr:hypothetical protein J6590_035123 [Homalodisca vitripennis]
MNAKISLPNCQLQLEELASEKDMFRKKYDVLVDKVHDMESKLVKGKQMRHELERIFEEQDQDGEEATAKDKAKKIKNLLNEIEQLKKIKKQSKY